MKDDKKMPPNIIITEKIKTKFLGKIQSLGEEKRIAIVTHKVPSADMDTLAVAMALKHYFSAINIDSDIFGSVGSSHPQNKTMVNRLQIELKNEDYFEENKDAYGLIIFCDTNAQNAFLNAKPDIVIDHHNENEVIKECLAIREKVGATSTIVYFLLKELSAEITPPVASALVLGIDMDTKDLTKTNEVTEFDKEAHRELLPQVDYPTFAKIKEQYEVPRQFITFMGKGLHSVVFDEYVAIIGLGETKLEQEHYYAIIADFVFRVPETRLVVVIGIGEGKAIQASVRTDLELIQMNDFCKEVFEASSETDTGTASAGARTGSGGARIPLSRRESEEWSIADEKEKEILFGVKMKRYTERIKKELNIT